MARIKAEAAARKERHAIIDGVRALELAEEVEYHRAMETAAAIPDPELRDATVCAVARPHDRWTPDEAALVRKEKQNEEKRQSRFAKMSRRALRRLIGLK